LLPHSDITRTLGNTGEIDLQKLPRLSMTVLSVGGEEPDEKPCRKGTPRAYGPLPES
jgi:hypothetical protein